MVARAQKPSHAEFGSIHPGKGTEAFAWRVLCHAPYEENRSPQKLKHSISKRKRLSPFIPIHIGCLASWCASNHEFLTITSKFVVIVAEKNV